MVSDLFAYAANIIEDAIALLAKKPDVTNALAAVASAVTAVLALTMSLVAVVVSCLTLMYQRRHNVLSVKPIPAVTYADLEESIRVKLRNHGSGPLLVKCVKVSNGNQTRDAVVEWMPRLPKEVSWTFFAGVIADRSLLPGSEIVLLELDGDPKTELFRAGRDATRDALAPLTVRVDYTDIYDSHFEPYVQDLAWFGRIKGG
jgi:hypothetical protein